MGKVLPTPYMISSATDHFQAHPVPLPGEPRQTGRSDPALRKPKGPSREAGGHTRVPPGAGRSDGFGERMVWRSTKPERTGRGAAAADAQQTGKPLRQRRGGGKG